MKKKIDFDQILNGLGSDEARNLVISKLVGKVDLSTSRVEETIKAYEKAGMFSYAADIALKAGMNEKAVEYYERAGSFYGAADAALKAGMNEKAVEYYERAGSFYEASNAALKAGMEERAKQLITLAKLINE